VRGTSRGRSEEGPRRLDASLGAVARRLGLEDPDGLGRLFGDWKEVVGPAVAAHVQPIRIDSDTLVVEVDHPAWGTQVKALGDDLLDRIAEQTGLARPHQIDVRIRRSRR
jgi:predicted nucleic acid-binding Zn ribbon protein